MFSVKRVKQARELRGLTQSALAKRVGVSQAKIAHIEGGFRDPSRGTIAAVALQTKFPLSFFLTDPSVEFSLESLLFRSHASMTRRQGIEACRYAEVLYEAARALASHVDPIPVTLPKTSVDAEAAATLTRAHFQLSKEEPIKHLINLAEKSGVLVLALPTNLAGRESFSLWVERQPVIALSRGKPGDRLRLSVAHELGHLVMSHHSHWSPENERDAYRFGAELLMPRDAFRRELPTPVTLSGIAMLKPRWKVSVQAMIRRAYDLNIISERQYRYLFEQLSIRGWRSKEPSNLDVPSEKPRALRQMAELIYGNPINYPGLAADLNMRLESVREIMDGYAEASRIGKQTRENLIRFSRA